MEVKLLGMLFSKPRDRPYNDVVDLVLSGRIWKTEGYLW